MNSKSQSFKIYLGSAYLVIFLTGIYFLLSNFEISQLTSYDLIKENRDLFLKFGYRYVPVNRYSLLVCISLKPVHVHDGRVRLLGLVELFILAEVCIAELWHLVCLVLFLRLLLTPLHPHLHLSLRKLYL